MNKLTIPFILNRNNFVEIFPDELLDIDVEELHETLTSEIAPLPSWRHIAVSYHNQGRQDLFSSTLKLIIEAIDDEEVVRSKLELESGPEGYKNQLAQVYEALAANAMSSLVRMRHEYAGVLPADAEEKAVRDGREVELKQLHQLYMKKTQDTRRFDEYHSIIKGFWSLFIEGDAIGAEAQFKIVHSKAVRADATKEQKSYLYAASVGLGICLYAEGKWQLALEHFSKAIQANPGCPASVRVAVASCCFKLGQYGKARLAANVAVEIDPTQADAFCMLALIEQADAVKDRTKRREHRLAANDYWMIAYELDRQCSPALIHLANYHFNTWKKLGSCRVENDIMIKVDKAKIGGLMVGDRLIFDDVEKNVVKEISSMGDQVILTLAERVSANRVGESTEVKFKEYGRVLALALEACKNTTIKQLWAESYYIQGRVYHDRGNTEKATQMYSEALKKWEGMDLAAFALGKIELSHNNFDIAMAHFEAVAKRIPEDRDTQAYLCLIRALNCNEMSSYEKIKDVAAGFEYDVDLWLANGNLRQKLPEEFGVALKCYQAAIDLLKGRTNMRNRMMSQVLNNIAMLQLNMGRVQPALESIKSSLIYAQNDAPVDDQVNPAFSHSEFDKVFYSWSEMPSTFVKRGGEDNLFTFTDSSGASLNLGKGHEVLIDDVVHVVESVNPTGIVAYSPVDVFAVGGSKQTIVPLKLKMLGHNFNYDTITLCFNFARILEDSGRLDAASEIYLALIKKNPAFIEAYLRMSSISMNARKVDAAKLWVLRALNVDNKNSDALAAKADLHYRLGEDDMVHAICDDMLKSENKDSRASLVIGNLYFRKHQAGEKKRPVGGATQDQIDKDGNYNLKKCDDFINKTLRKDLKNMYAANGIGMLCIEQDEHDAASEIFLRAKEFSRDFTDDIDNNLAHTRLIQNRTAEAEHLYQLNMRSITKSFRTPEPGKLSAMCEAAAYAQFKQKRFEDAIRSLLRGMHHDPTNFAIVEKHWFNIAVVRQEQAISKLQKKGKRTVRAVQDAKDEFQMAKNLFTFLSSDTVVERTHTKIPAEYNVETARGLINMLKNWCARCDVALKDAEKDEEAVLQDRERRNAEHQARLRVQEAERAIALEAAAEAKREIQRLAGEKQKRLDELKAGWTAAPVTESKSKDKKGKKGRNKGGHDDDVDAHGSAAYTNGVYESDSDDGLGGGLLSKKPEDKDPFAEDSDEDDEIFGNKRKIEATGTGDGKRLKKNGVVDADSDDDALFGDEATQPQAPSVDDLFNDSD